MNLDEIKRLFVGNITSTESTIMDLANSAVIKTILIFNDNAAAEIVSLIIDRYVFKFSVDTKTTLKIESPIVCNNLKVKTTTNTVNIHISGIQLGGV